MTHTADAPEVLWRPDPSHVADTKIEAFRQWLRDEGRADLDDYASLWDYSVQNVPEFWAGVADFLGVRWHEPPREVLSGAMPTAKWFDGGTLNYAEHSLSPGVAGAAKADDELAVIFHREDGLAEQITYGRLRGQVAAARSALQALGVGKGDRVVALAPNCPQTLVAFLATASLGAIWSSCSPDFGVRAVADRFVQIEPKVLFAVNGYAYNGRSFDIRKTIDDLRDKLPSLAATVLVQYVGEGALDGTL
ncbi:MAG TPA: AMP-binding protein, partial [Amycolatopsis sp.]|nr:AMP-binding protein [Amycolatopsis sp.]